jgi:hypothetical protein
MPKQPVQNKKSMIKKLDLQPVTKEVRRYERPSLQQQLQTAKGKLFSAPAKPQPRTTEFTMVAADFAFQKNEPLEVDGWQIWKSATDKLIVMPKDKRDDQRYYTFDLEDGILYLVTKPGSQYAYFHNSAFNEFVKKYGITRVLRREPNGEYQGRNDTHKNTVSTFLLVTDGDAAEFESSQSRIDEEPLVAMKFPTVFTVVKNASFVLFEQIAYRQDIETGSDEDKPFMLRQLVTDFNIFDLEDSIAAACAALDASQNDEVVEEVATSVE